MALSTLYKNIVEFGFHLVPVGHPLSDTNMMEWRISFAVAERALVWSFNHVQMQCYAVMKLILKEYINPHCSPQCRVLCSYFIKTFLFWEYEETDPSYWHKENLRECLMRLLSNFCECVRSGYLRHYFIPSFNLLSVKMTRDVQRELLSVFDAIRHADISIIKECKSLNKVWIECLNHDADQTCVAETIQRHLLRSDLCMMRLVQEIEGVVLTLRRLNHVDSFKLISPFINHFQLHRAVYKTHLTSFAMRILLHHASNERSYIPLQSVRNKTLYGPLRFLQSNAFGIDITTSRLWYAMYLTKCGDYRLSLSIINKVLSNISPSTLYYTDSDLFNTTDETKRRYVDTFSINNTRVTARARRAWMFNLNIQPYHMDMVPTAIQIELIHCDKNKGVTLSPFVCAYYLLFLNYCGLCQYDNRDRALRQLSNVIINREQWGLYLNHTCNIAGHCLLSVGETEQARDMFMLSNLFTTPNLRFHYCNSAQYYLQCLPNNAANTCMTS